MIVRTALVLRLDDTILLFLADQLAIDIGNVLAREGRLQLRVDQELRVVPGKTVLTTRIENRAGEGEERPLRYFAADKRPRESKATSAVIGTLRDRKFMCAI